ncbi:MAG: hypothetical protein R8G66_33155 [Cytophagales bacterium]|nr:hypothetical protein [Cytophagales bacterium]
MKKDIQFLPVKDVFFTVAQDQEEWKVYLINRGSDVLENVMITSKGYGEKDGKKQETSVLRHGIPKLEAGEFALIEPIDPQVFHLNNEYWLSFFIGTQVYDKKYIFVPDSISENNLSFIPELNLRGVIHL